MMERKMNRSWTYSNSVVEQVVTKRYLIVLLIYRFPEAQSQISTTK